VPEKTTTPTMEKPNKEEIKTWQDHTTTRQVDIIVHLKDNNININKLKLDHKIHNINNQDKLIPINSIMQRIWGQKISLKFLIYKSQWD